MRNPYEDLGISKDADPAEIKAAYKKKVQETHPDKVGGNREEFDKVQDAYLVLRDPEKREHYDKTGKEKIEPKEMHLSIIGSLFEQLLSKDDLPYNFDYVETVKKSLVNMRDETNEKLKGLAEDIVKYEKLKNKFHRKNKKVKKVNGNEPNNFFKQAIESRIRNTVEAQKNGETLMLNITRALEIMDDYEFELDKGPPPQQTDNDVREAFYRMVREIRKSGGGGPFGSGSFGP